MSKRVQYPDGKIGVASDKAAKILARKPGHKILAEKGQKEKPEQGQETDPKENEENGSEGGASE